MEKIKVVGKCLYCNKEFLKQGLTKHITTHLQELSNSTSEIGMSVHLLVKSGDFFLHLLVPETNSLKTIDTFLRKIWLECCGHMSQFTTDGWGNSVGMARKVNDIFQLTNKLTYQYDFGTTTELDIELKGVYPIQTKSIVLLSRNEPLPIMCHTCNVKPAVSICTIHIYDDAPAYFCEDCATKHQETCEDFADDAAASVVNSPRCGECGYEGGTIDVERDGVYVVK